MKNLVDEIFEKCSNNSKRHTSIVLRGVPKKKSDAQVMPTILHFIDVYWHNKQNSTIRKIITWAYEGIYNWSHLKWIVPKPWPIQASSCYLRCWSRTGGRVTECQKITRYLLQPCVCTQMACEKGKKALKINFATNVPRSTNAKSLLQTDKFIRSC